MLDSFQQHKTKEINMKNTLKKYGNWALVTGGSSGIGLSFADQLAEQGHNIIIVARGEEALAASAAEISNRHGVEVETIAMDLRLPDAPQQLFLKTNDREVGLIVLSAGMETTGHYTKVPAKTHRSLIDLNIQAPAELARLYGAQMVQRGRGGIVFLSSLFGYQGVPLVANYAASKAYILTLGEALHVEMKPLGVDVLVVSPGLTDTKMPENMPVNFNRMPLTRHKPEKVVRTALRKLGHQASVVPGLVNKIYAFENRFIPRLWPTHLFGFLLRMNLKKDHRSQLLNMKISRQGM